MKIDSYKQGTPCWIDFPTVDVEQAKSFYASIFGWSYQVDIMDDNGAEFAYTMASLRGSNVAGFFAQDEEQQEMVVPVSWNIYLAVDDVDLTASQVESCGGTLLFPPFDVPNGSGRLTVLADPNGAYIGLWQSKNHVGCDIKDEDGAMSWAQLVTRGSADAVGFYAELLGIETDTGPAPGGGVNTVLMVDGEPEAGIMEMPEQIRDSDIPNHWEVYFQVRDLSATVDKAASNGANPVMPSGILPGIGRIAYLIDPQGAGFGLVTPISD